MRALQTLAGEFQEEDIYNIDETGLYWQMTHSQGLATHSQPGLKKSKARISLALVSIQQTTIDSQFGLLESQKHHILLEISVLLQWGGNGDGIRRLG